MAEPATEWRDRVVRALGTVVVVGLVIGGVLGAVAYSAARAAGLAGGEAQTAAPAAANETAGGQPTTSPTSSSPSPAKAEPTPRKQQAKSGEGQTPKSHKTSKQRANDKRRAGRRAGHHPGLTLAASPRQVHRMGRIHLMGRYPGHGGARLVVQRFEGGHWARFPVSVTVRGGRYRTWVASGHRGVNRFRVVDAATRRASAPVSVRVL